MNIRESGMPNQEMWESFFNILTVRKIKPVSYVVDLFKHIILSSL